MPYVIAKNDAGKFCVHKENADKSPGETVHCHDTEAMAQAQMRALYAAENKALELLQDALKIGARNNAGDAKRLQDIHDAAVACGAKCDMGEMGEMEGKSADTDTLIFYGAEVKALGNGRVGGYLLRYSTANDPDLTADFFTSETYTGKAEQLDVYYQHGLDPQIGKRVIGEAKAKRDDVGLWVEAQLNMRDAYEKQIYELARAGKLGWSSGAVSHLVERKSVGNAYHVTRWPIAEASLTPTPAEPRNAAISLKSFATMPGRAALDGAGDVPQTTTSTKGVTPMSDNTAPAPSNELAELKAQFSELLTELRKPKLPAKDAPAITEVKDNAEDGAFKSLAANLRAIKDSSAGERVHPRLAKLAQEFKAATGLNEGVGSEGGFLLEPTITREVLMPMRTPETSPFASRARKLPVSNGSNSGWINGVDETSRATGSRWGGIQGYRLAEAAQKTASKPTFRRLSWALKKYAVLMYATDELLQDAAMVAEVFRMGAGEELTFMLNDDILNGNGAAGPNGILNSNSLVTVAKASGQAAATFVNKNISAMWQALHPRFRANAAWFINSEVEPQLDELTLPAGTGGLEPRYVTFGPDGVTRIKGKPVIVTEFNAALGTVGDVVLANLDDYLLWERGPEFASSIHLRFDYDESVFRAVYRCDGLTATPKLTPYKGSVQQSAFVALATRS